MKICKWVKCGAEFEPVKDNQEFCKPEHRHAYNNWLKVTGHHLIPRIELKLQVRAKYLEKQVDQFLNEIVDMAIPTAGRSMSDDEIKGINKIEIDVKNEEE